MAIERTDVIDYIKNLTVLELSELVKELEDVLGVSAAAPTAAAAGPAPARLRLRRRPSSPSR